MEHPYRIINQKYRNKIKINRFIPLSFMVLNLLSYIGSKLNSRWIFLYL